MKLSWCSQGGSSESGFRQVGRRVQGCSCHGLSAFAVCFLAKVEDVPNELHFETKQVSVCSLSSPASEKSLQVFEQVLIFLTCYEAHMQNYCFGFYFDYRTCPNLCWIWRFSLSGEEGV